MTPTARRLNKGELHDITSMVGRLHLNSTGQTRRRLAGCLIGLRAGNGDLGPLLELIMAAMDEQRAAAGLPPARPDQLPPPDPDILKLIKDTSPRSGLTTYEHQ